MAIVTAIPAVFLGALLGLAGLTRFYAWRVARRHPPAGAFTAVEGVRLHYLFRPAPADADLPPLVFIHGASANLQDQAGAFDALLQDRAALLFFDRPGHGWSERGARINARPDRQARLLAGLMTKLGLSRAIIVGHSFGGAVAASFALRFPERTAGLVFLSAATHPWPGGVAWYYRLLSRPVLGSFFAHTLATPMALLRIGTAITSVFAPNPVPPRYRHRSATDLLIRPGTFRANAGDVSGLKAYLQRTSVCYPDICAPAIIITGDRDAVVYDHIHSEGLARDIAGSKLVRVRNLGHKPDYVAAPLVVGAIESLAGRQVDLEALAAQVEARIAGDGAVAPQIPESPSAPI